jgi:hypothetical protein
LRLLDARLLDLEHKTLDFKLSDRRTKMENRNTLSGFTILGKGFFPLRRNMGRNENPAFTHLNILAF